MNYLFFSFMNYLFFSSSRSLLSPSQSSPLPPPSPRSRFHSKRASTNPIPRLRWQAAVAAFSYAMQRERADFSPEPRGSPFRRPPPGRRHWSDFSSLDSAHAGRLCARTGLHQGQKCIYCNGPYGATCILWPCGGGCCLLRLHGQGSQWRPRSSGPRARGPLVEITVVVQDKQVEGRDRPRRRG